MCNLPTADSNFVIVSFSASYTESVTSLWREAHADVTGIPPIHPFDEQAEYLKTVLTEKYCVFTALTSTDNIPVGFMAASSVEISQLYIHPNFQGLGLGGQFMKLAKEMSAGRLTLRTFEKNTRAQTFYERHGFTSQPGDTNNEEGLSDRLYTWQSITDNS